MREAGNGPRSARFLSPILVLAACAAAYGQLAVGRALPDLVPQLLEHSVETESRLRRDFRALVLTLSVLMPLLFVPLTALSTWGIARLTRVPASFVSVLSLVAYASLWIAAGFVAKAFLVLATGTAEPPVNLALLLDRPTRGQRLATAFTNPFLLLALFWTVRGLRSWGMGWLRAAFAGGSPWLLWAAVVAIGSGGTTSRLKPSGPVSYEGWETIAGQTVSLSHAPEAARDARRLAAALDAFSVKLGERFDFGPEPIRVRLFADHRSLERASGEFLHVKLTGSIRGRDLLFLEAPGRSVARPEDEGVQEALRYVALMHLAPAPGLRECPRWFVEGLAHAAALPPSARLQSEYRAALRRGGVPQFAWLLDASTFRTPEGPLLARSVVDHIAFRHGPEVLLELVRDVREGTTFRDALFARTRYTTSALEAEWQDTAVAMLGSGGGAPEPRPERADSLLVGPRPFLDRN